MMLKNANFTSIFTENRQDSSGYRVASQFFFLQVFTHSNARKKRKKSRIHLCRKKNRKDSSSFRVVPRSFSSFRFSYTRMVEKTKCQDSSSLIVAPHSFSSLRFSYTKFPSIFAQIRQKNLKFLHRASISRESVKDT